MEGEGEGAEVGAMDRVEASFVEKFVASLQEIGRANAFTVCLLLPCDPFLSSSLLLLLHISSFQGKNKNGCKYKIHTLIFN